MSKHAVSGGGIAVYPRGERVETSRALADAAKRYSEDRDPASAVVEAFAAWLAQADVEMNGPTRAGLLLRFPWLAEVGRGK